jgi:hypothetical protein
VDSKDAHGLVDALELWNTWMRSVGPSREVLMPWSLACGLSSPWSLLVECHHLGA